MCLGERMHDCMSYLGPVLGASATNRIEFVQKCVGQKFFSSNNSQTNIIGWCCSPLSVHQHHHIVVPLTMTTTTMMMVVRSFVLSQLIEHFFFYSQIKKGRLFHLRIISKIIKFHFLNSLAREK